MTEPGGSIAGGAGRWAIARRRLTARLGALAPDLLVICAYALLTAISTYPLLLNFTSAIPGDGGDGWQNYWNLWWVKRALFDLRSNPFFTTDIYYPQGAPLYFHALLLFPSLLALPVVAVFGLTVGYNSLVLLAFIAGGYGAYCLVKYLISRESQTSFRCETVVVPSPHPGRTEASAATRLFEILPRSRSLPLHPRWTETSAVTSEISHQEQTSPGQYTQLAAFIAGSAFTFSGYHFVRLLGHLDLVSLQWIPFYVLFLLKTWHEPGWRNALLAALLLGATTLTNWYYGLYLLFFSGLFIAYHLCIEYNRPHIRRSVAHAGIALGAFALVLAPIFVPMLALGRSMGRVANPLLDTVRYSADLLAFVVPSYLHPLWGEQLVPVYHRLIRDGNGIEGTVFLGYATLLLAGYAAKRIWARHRFWIIAFVFFSILALGPALHVAGQTVTIFGRAHILPYRLFYILPYADILHVASRFAVMSSLCLTVLVGYGALKLLRRVQRPIHANLASALITGWILFENAVVPFPISPVVVPPFYTLLAQETHRGAVLEVPIPEDPAVYPRRMLYQTFYNKPSYGGYLSRRLTLLPYDTLPGFAQFKRLSPQYLDIVRYDEHELPAIGRAVLNSYGAGYVVVDKSLLDPTEEEGARAVAASIFDGASAIYEDDTTLAYAVLPSAVVPSTFAYLGLGWHKLEQVLPDMPADHPSRWRWMPEQAQLLVLASQAGQWRVSLRAWSFAEPRRLAIHLEDTVIAILEIEPRIGTYEIPVSITSSGTHILRFESLDAVGIPGNGDGRALSVAIAEIKVKAW